MPFESELYPPEWRATRQAKLKAANYRCEECNVRDRTIQLNRNQEPYIVYLSIAHKKQYQTWMRNAETMVLCQRCHRRYDRQFRRKTGARTHAPIGCIKVFVELENGGEVLAEYAVWSPRFLMIQTSPVLQKSMVRWSATAHTPKSTTTKSSYTPNTGRVLAYIHNSTRLDAYVSLHL